MRRSLWLLLVLATAATANAQDDRAPRARRRPDARRAKERVFAVYTEADRDGDGVLSASEWDAGRRAFPEGEDTGFTEVDRDGDGVVDRLEVRVLLGGPERPLTLDPGPDEEPADHPAEPDRRPGGLARLGTVTFPTVPDEFARWARDHRKDLLTLARDGKWMDRHVGLVEAMLDDWHAAIAYPEVVDAVFSHVDFWSRNRLLTKRYVTPERLEAFERRHRNYAGALRKRFIDIWQALKKTERLPRDRRGPRPGPGPGRPQF